MNESERQALAIKLYNDWQGTDTSDSLEIYCYLQGKADAIDEYKNKLWEDIEARYKNDIKFLGYLSADKLLHDVHNSIRYFAKQLKKRDNILER